MEGSGFFDDVYSKVLKPTANASLDALGKSLPILSQAGIEYATRKVNKGSRGKERLHQCLLNEQENLPYMELQLSFQEVIPIK